MSAMKDTALRLVAWVDEHYTSLTQALEAMAEHNEKNAATLSDLPVVRDACIDSAKSWRRMAAELTTIYEGLEA